MKNDEKLLKDRVNKNDNSKEKIEKKKNKNIDEALSCDIIQM